LYPGELLICQTLAPVPERLLIDQPPRPELKSCVSKVTGNGVALAVNVVLSPRQSVAGVVGLIVIGKVLIETVALP
jgi:hypothetical protein